MKTYAWHVKCFVTAADVVFPVGKGGGGCAKGEKHAGGDLRAGVCKPLVDAGDVFVEQTVEAACPSLGNSSTTKVCDKFRRRFAGKLLVRPVAQVDVRVGD